MICFTCTCDAQVILTLSTRESPSVVLLSRVYEVECCGMLKNITKFKENIYVGTSF